MRFLVFCVGILLVPAMPARAGISDPGDLVIGGTVTVSGSDFTVGTSTLVVKDGKVGIGKPDPVRALHVGCTDGMRLDPSALPASAAIGDIVVDSGDSNKLKWFNGSSWQEAGGGGGGGDFSNGGEAGGADRTLGNTDNYDFGFLTNNQTRVHIQNGGNVGIGTTNPGNIVDIEHVTSPTMSVEDTTNNVRWIANADDDYAITGVSSNHPLRIVTNNTLRAYIEPGGQMAVGTNITNAEARLEVVPEEADRWALQVSSDDGNTNLFRVTHEDAQIVASVPMTIEGSSLTVEGSAVIAGSFTVRSNGSEIILSTSTNGYSWKMNAETGVVSVSTPFANSIATNNAISGGTTAGSFGPCLSGSTVTLMTNGDTRLLIFFAGSVANTNGSGCYIGMNFLQDGDFVSPLSSAKGVFLYSSGEHQAGLSLNGSWTHLMETVSAGEHSYCMTLKTNCGTSSVSRDANQSNLFGAMEVK
ncbi:hypothetical protein ACFL2T_00765 [Elusimicrobiota bacterium]